MNFEKNVWIIIKFLVVILVTSLISIIGVIIFLPIADLLIKSQSPFFFGFGGFTAGFVGALMSFIFCFSIVIVTFIKKYKYYLFIVIFILDLLPLYFVYGGNSDLFNLENLQILVIIFITMLVGWLIGEGILRIWKMVKK